MSRHDPDPVPIAASIEDLRGDLDFAHELSEVRRYEIRNGRGDVVAEVFDDLDLLAEPPYRRT